MNDDDDHEKFEESRLFHLEHASLNSKGLKLLKSKEMIVRVENLIEQSALLCIGMLR